MKYMIVALILAVTPTLFAAETDTMKNISCKTADAKESLQLTLVSKLYVGAQVGASKANGRLLDVAVTASSPDSFVGGVETGRRDSVFNDENYKTRKFPDHFRFDMSTLINPVDFSNYEPIDSCQIQILVPIKGIEAASFQAHAIVNCDQGGFSQDLACSVSAVK